MVVFSPTYILVSFVLSLFFFYLQRFTNILDKALGSGSELVQLL